MKKYLVLLTLAVSFVLSGFAHAQTDTGTVVIKKSDLTAEQLAKIESQQKVQEVTQKLQAVHEWAGIGKEIGEAVNDGLKAVTTQAATFAETNPGKLTMFLIAWKVMAKDVLELCHGLKGTLVGIPFLIFLDSFLIFMWLRTTRSRTILTTEDEKGKHYQQVETWFTKDDAESTNRVTFMVAWWIVALIGNIWLLAGVIL